MTEAERTQPTRMFPRLYDPNREETETELLLGLAELSPIPQTLALFEPPSTHDDVTTNPLPHNLYVVMLHSPDEDLPIALFKDGAAAVIFARQVRGNPDTFAKAYFDAVDCPENCRKLEWTSVAVVEFRGPLPHCRTELFEIDSH